MTTTVDPRSTTSRDDDLPTHASVPTTHVDPRTLSPRRRLLMQCALEVVAADGIRGLTHRAVDRRAALAEGTCSAYLRTSRALRVALAQYVCHQLTSDVERLVDDRVGGCDDAVRGLVEATEGMLVGWVREPTLALAQQELATVARRDPDLAGLMACWRARLADCVSAVLVHVRQPDPAVRSQAMVAACEGLLGAALLLPEHEREPFLHRSVDLVAGGVLVS